MSVNFEYKLLESIFEYFKSLIGNFWFILTYLYSSMKFILIAISLNLFFVIMIKFSMPLMMCWAQN